MGKPGNVAGFIFSFSIIYVLLGFSFVRAELSNITTNSTQNKSTTSNCTAVSQGNGSAASACRSTSITSECEAEANNNGSTSCKTNYSSTTTNSTSTIYSSSNPQNISEAPQPSRSQTDIAPSPLTAPNKPESRIPLNRHRKNLAPVVAGSTVGGLTIISLLIGVFLVVVRRTKVGEDYVKPVPGMPVRFSYEELCKATEDFKERIGGGGFGSVFKGVLTDGTTIAVKRLEKVSQGMKEFIAEVETIGSVHHFNLVRLKGFCAEKSSRLLVYEYMSNGSLDNWIFCRDPRPCLDWQTRKNIILDIAKGLAYLHEDCRRRIIHLDIKPQNILLDEKFNAKVSDFGLSKLINRDESQVQTKMRGTPGYMAPEWQQLKITLKVDTYSFGIVLLETICTRRNLDNSLSESSMHLLRVLQQKAEEDRLFDSVDKFDEEMQSHREEVERMIRIGAWCLQDDHTKRPLMSTVVKALEGLIEVDLNINYKFAHAMASSSVVNDHVASPAPPASVLSGPR